MHKSRTAYLTALRDLFEDQTEFTRPELRAAAVRCGLKWTPNWTCDPSRRISRGLFRVTEHLAVTEETPQEEVVSDSESESVTTL